MLGNGHIIKGAAPFPYVPYKGMIMHRQYLAAAFRGDPTALEHVRTCKGCLSALESGVDADSIVWDSHLAYRDVCENHHIFCCSQCRHHLPNMYSIAQSRLIAAAKALGSGISIGAATALCVVCVVQTLNLQDDSESSPK